MFPKSILLSEVVILLQFWHFFYKGGGGLNPLQHVPPFRATRVNEAFGFNFLSTHIHMICMGNATPLTYILHGSLVCTLISIYNCTEFTEKNLLLHLKKLTHLPPIFKCFHVRIQKKFPRGGGGPKDNCVCRWGGG